MRLRVFVVLLLSLFNLIMSSSFYPAVPLRLYARLLSDVNALVTDLKYPEIVRHTLDLCQDSFTHGAHSRMRIMLTTAGALTAGA